MRFEKKNNKVKEYRGESNPGQRRVKYTNHPLSHAVRVASDCETVRYVCNVVKMVKYF